MRVCVPTTGDCGINVKKWHKQRIFSFFTLYGSIRENDPCNIITHIDDLKDILPDEDFMMS